MQEYLSSLSVYNNRKILIVFFLGFVSGLPLPLTGATLDAVLNQAGVTKTAIGLFAIVSLPYSLKFLWSPLIDRIPIPILTKLLGRRRSWLILTQFSLLISIIMLGYSNPSINLMQTALLALWVAFSSASQDIVIDAYRVEILEENQQGAGASASTTGYILAMKLISGALAFFLSDIIGWQAVYFIMGLAVLLGVLAVIIAPEPKIRQENLVSKNFSSFFFEGVYKPLADFFAKPYWFLIIAFITLYKFGDAFAGKMTTPFLQDIGFTNTDLAFYLKTFGLAATLVGTFLGGILVYKLGKFRALFIGGILQMVSNLSFIMLYYAGNNEVALAVTVAVENLSAGVGTAAFVAYLSGLCNISYTATQYALLSSFASTGRTILSSSSGYFVQSLGWVGFFSLSVLIAIPGIIVLLYLQKKDIKN